MEYLIFFESTEKLTNSTLFADENLEHASYTKETWDPHQEKCIDLNHPNKRV